MKFFKKTKEEEKFPSKEKELFFWKKEYRKILSFEPKNAEEKKEVSLRKVYVENKLMSAEQNMIDVKKGLYLGIGYEMGNKTNPSPTPIYAKWSNLNNHLGTKGTTRVGKSYCMYGHIDQCIANGWDVFVIDPKGGEGQEVLSSVAESCFKHSRSSDLSYFSPAHESISEKINLLYGMSNMEVAATIMDSIKTPGMDDFYIQTGTRILLSITMGFEFLQAISDPDNIITRYLEEQEIKSYLDFRQAMSKEDKYGLVNYDMIDKFSSTIFQNKELEELKNIGFNRSLMTYRDLERFCNYKELTNLRDLIANIPLNENRAYSFNKMSKLKKEALSALNSALSTTEDHFSSVSGNLSNRLLQLSVGPMGELLCGTRINPILNSLLREDKGIVSVIQPFPMKFKSASTMFNKMILGMFDSLMGNVGAQGITFPRRIAIFIDEFGAIAYPGIENFFNRAGGLGITVFAYTQSDEDYNESVGETIAKIILDNINTTITMRLNYKKSRDDAAEEIGYIKTHRTIAMVGAGGAEGKYTTDTRDELLCTPADIKKLPMGEGILSHDGKTYYLEVPFRTKLEGNVVVPKLASEEAKQYLSSFSQEYEDYLQTGKESQLLIDTQHVVNNPERVAEGDTN